MEAEVTLVYKTYANDLKWIYNSLSSVKKFVIGPYKLIIYCHDACFHQLLQIVQKVNITCHVIPVKYDYHGYLKQMAVKANSFKDVKTTYTAIVDSDIIFKHRFHINDLVATTNKKLQWTYWDNLPEDSEVKIWKKAFESMTKTPQKVYYMLNPFPFVFTTSSLAEASAKFQEMHGMDYDSWCAKGCKENNIAINAPLLGPNSMFSKITTIFEEFEWLGFFCHHFSNDYVFLPTTATHHWSHKNKNVSPHCVQFWSHGGITPEIEAQLKKLLK